MGGIPLETDAQGYIERVKSREREERRKARLISRFERICTGLLIRWLRAVRGKEVTPVIFKMRISHHEQEDILAEVDRMFE